MNISARAGGTVDTLKNHAREGTQTVNRDYYAGALMALIGVIAGYNAMQYQLGTLTRMGPGLFPLALSIILVSLGLLIALNAGEAEDTEGELHTLDPNASKYPDIKGCLAIMAGMIAFVVLAQTVGFVAGTFACVFISAIGDKDATWTGSFVLATVVTAIGMLVFVWGLKMHFPLFKWFTS